MWKKVAGLDLADLRRAVRQAREAYADRESLATPRRRRRADDRPLTESSTDEAEVPHAGPES